MERLIKIGDVKAKKSNEVKKSRIGIGFEKLDRNVFDPNKAYDKVADLGVKWIRLQSGWQRTEKQKGVYDFAWLDEIVDNLLKRGLTPWMCLCYGNGLYNEEAAKVFGAVGIPPIATEEERTAWANYVKALARHFKGRITHYEVWNEPNWFWTQVPLEHHPDGKEYAEFVIATTKAIKSEDENAKMIAGVESLRNLAYTNASFQAGMGDYIDYFSFHIYLTDERMIMERKNRIMGMLQKYNPNIKIIQGESGSASKSGGAGESSYGAWTQRKQAKFLLRHAMVDLMMNFEFSSYFSCIDMIEALKGRVGDKASYMDYGYFGLLGADFDENGFSTGVYTPKMSYRTIQTLASLFCDDVENTYLPIGFNTSKSERIFGTDESADILSCGFKKPNGSSAFAYWHYENLMTSDYESTVTIQAVCDGDIKLIDLLDGTVYQIPDNMIEETSGAYTLKNIPIKDYPLLLTFGDFQI